MNTPIYAYYFPNWHVTPQNEIWHGKGWTEWQCVKYAALSRSRTAKGAPVGL